MARIFVPTNTSSCLSGFFERDISVGLNCVVFHKHGMVPAPKMWNLKKGSLWNLNLNLNLNLTSG